MPDAKTCPTCGAPLAADAPGAACPRCLLAAGFATGPGGAPAAPDRAPTPEELAPHFPGLSIERLLGRGGMGVVYKARHKALDRDVALKVLPATVAGDPAFAERFQREARALAKLQHPNIVLVHDFGETGGLFWLVMEYVDGTNIRQAMKAGQVGPKEALAIVPQICDALQYAHEHGVVHRDIKPENVLLDRSGRVKVADFGLAKMMEHGEGDRTLTGAGQVMGTPHYMAPEQWEHPRDVDHRADIYSLGVVFYEMLTGELPIGRFAPPSEKTSIDARIDEIVLRTLAKEREARYQHADDVKTDVGRVAGGPAAPPPPPQVADAAATARVGRLSRLAVAAPLTMLLTVVAMIVVAAVSPVGDAKAAMKLGIGIGVMGAAWIVSIVAWVRIQNSGDRLRGRAWAAIGSFLPLVLCCGGAPIAFFVTGRSAPPPDSAPAPRASFAAESVHGSPITVSPDVVQRIDELWDRVRRLPSEPTLAAAAALYSDADRKGLEAMPAAILTEKAWAGELGLPLLPRAVGSSADYSRYNLTRVRFDVLSPEEAIRTLHAPTPADIAGRSPTSAVATATDGRRVIRFPLTRANAGASTGDISGEWFFAPGKVEFE